ncbi:MAG: hypothetical protein FJ144_08735 [Deltaproteobacteria bacterium]|nr:hypothetical protein [Deltaproteobacteria bacterium]
MLRMSRFLAIAASVATLVLAATISTRAADEEPPRGVRPGRDVEMRGELVEIGCYLRDGSRGLGHKTCALTCLKNGGRLAFLEDDTSTLYPLAGSTPASDPSTAVREDIAAHVSVHGRVYERAGSRVLVIEKVDRLRD